MQSHWESAKEAASQMWIGFILSVIANYLYVLIFGPVTTFIHTILLTLWMTVYSFIRSYLIRRYYNAKIKKMPEV